MTKRLQRDGIMEAKRMQIFEFFHEHKDSKRHRTESEQRENAKIEAKEKSLKAVRKP